jgi:hypothetical protein
MKDIVLQYFVTFSNKYNDITIVDNIIYIPGDETYTPGILDKTIKAIDYCVNILKIDYDYMVRSNISTVIDFNKLIIPDNNIDILYASPLTDYSRQLNTYDGMNNLLTQKVLYASGTSIILNKLGVDYLLNNSNKLNMKIVDDVAIGILMSNITNVKQLPHKMIWNNIDSDGIVFRNRTNNRNDDNKRMKTIVSNILSN